jgi:hypothetical protein
MIPSSGAFSNASELSYALCPPNLLHQASLNLHPLPHKQGVLL